MTEQPESTPTWRTVADDAPTTVEHAKVGPNAGDFVARPDAQVLCLTCRTEFSAAEHAQADHMRRLEGASDPADQLIIVDVVCPSCGTAGVLTLGFGPEASGVDVDALAAIERDPALPHVAPRQPPSA